MDWQTSHYVIHGCDALGMGVLMTPQEMLPDFFVNFIRPWVPIRFASEGLREIFYFGSGFYTGAFVQYNFRNWYCRFSDLLTVYFQTSKSTKKLTQGRNW